MPAWSVDESNVRRLAILTSAYSGLQPSVFGEALGEPSPRLQVAYGRITRTSELGQRRPSKSYKRTTLQLYFNSPTLPTPGLLRSAAPFIARGPDPHPQSAHPQDISLSSPEGSYIPGAPTDKASPTTTTEHPQHPEIPGEFIGVSHKVPLQRPPRVMPPLENPWMSLECSRMIPAPALQDTETASNGLSRLHHDLTTCKTHHILRNLPNADAAS